MKAKKPGLMPGFFVPVDQEGAEMQADFLDAHQRHWNDAEYLFQAQRWANADHLYGMAAECGLKYLMAQFGMRVDLSTGDPVNKDDRKHADVIWDRFTSYRSGREAAHYVLPTANPFLDWRASQRYAHQSNFDQARAQSHKVGAQMVCELVERKKREGSNEGLLP